MHNYLNKKENIFNAFFYPASVSSSKHNKKGERDKNEPFSQGDRSRYMLRLNWVFFLKFNHHNINTLQKAGLYDDYTTCCWVSVTVTYTCIRSWMVFSHYKEDKEQHWKFSVVGKMWLSPDWLWQKFG